MLIVGDAEAMGRDSSRERIEMKGWICDTFTSFLRVLELSTALCYTTRLLTAVASYDHTPCFQYTQPSGVSPSQHWMQPAPTFESPEVFISVVPVVSS